MHVAANFRMEFGCGAARGSAFNIAKGARQLACALSASMTPRLQFPIGDMRMTVAGFDFVDMDAAFIRLRRDVEYQIFKRVLCRETASDLASEIYLKLKRVSPLCSTDAEAWTYLHKMAMTAAIDHVRGNRRRRELLEEFPLEAAGETPSPEAIVTARREAEIVDAAMQELPQRMQDMLYMSRVLGMTYSEIAQEFGVSRSLTEKVVGEALLHCRNRRREVAEWEASREAVSTANTPKPIRFVSALRARIRTKRS
jgi:RNA polymerase sigma factor (sigma-70 family)